MNRILMNIKPPKSLQWRGANDGVQQGKEVEKATCSGPTADGGRPGFISYFQTSGLCYNRLQITMSPAFAHPCCIIVRALLYQKR